MPFSIVIPAYNCISFLRGRVDSVLSQHFDDSEVILVDDGSTDGTSELCDELAKGERLAQKPSWHWNAPPKQEEDFAL